MNDDTLNRLAIARIRRAPPAERLDCAQSLSAPVRASLARAPPAMSEGQCFCVALSQQMADERDAALARRVAELVMLAAHVFPPEVVLIIGRGVCAFRVTSFAQRAFVGHSPRLFQEAHVAWARNTQELWWHNNMEEFGVYEEKVQEGFLLPEDRARARRECGAIARRHSKRARALLDMIAAGR